MSTPPNPPLTTAPGRRQRIGLLIIFGVLVILVFCGFRAVGCLHLGSETNALRAALMDSTEPGWKKRITIRVGRFTTALARTGLQFVQLPPEARAALDSVQGGEVGVYELDHQPHCADRSHLFVAMDKAMEKKGWTRIVGVAQQDQLVSIYMPAKGFSSNRIQCCLAVLSHRELVVVAAHGNPEPLMQVLMKKFELEQRHRELARQ
jgi:hypothetical protein